ncbi:oxalyl-CoA decarboxylase [Nocardioides conyzicola]|uniref:Oxalyl-CoA decarboxylase n=1 Tax=Nocardioides conyzicola TaxID=1651781 RepID=A0ABP8WW11_9ACTN
MTVSETQAPLSDGIELVVDALVANGIDTVYGVVGIPVTDVARVAQARGMRYIGFRHEQSAGHAAAAAGFLGGRPGVCLTVSAPGFLNGLVATANATTNCFPMIQISGSSDRAVVDLQRGGYEELDQLATARPLVKAAFRVERVEDVGLGVARAVRTAMSGRPGGVYLDLPSTTLGAAIAADEAARSVITVVDPAPRQLVSLDALNRAVEVIESARRPLVVIGKGVAQARAEHVVTELVERTGMPFLPMSMAKGVLPDGHPQSVAAARSMAIAEADVVVLLGARLNWLLGHGRSPQWAEDARFVQVEVEPEELDSNRPIAAPLVGDLVSVVGQLATALRPGGIRIDQGWLDRLSEHAARNAAKMAARLAADVSPMNFSTALGAVRDVLAAHPGTILVNEGANALDFARDILPMTMPRRRLDCGTWGVMGVGLGYAVAAAVETGLPVLAIEGDSAFGFSGMEVETICRYGLPVTTVVLNNGGIYRGDDPSQAPPQPAPTALSPSARYDQLAEAFGGSGYHVETPTELTKALEAAYAEGRPAVVNCVIDPTAGTESGHIGGLNPQRAASAAS